MAPRCAPACAPACAPLVPPLVPPLGFVKVRVRAHAAPSKASKPTSGHEASKFFAPNRVLWSPYRAVLLGRPSFCNTGHPESPPDSEGLLLESHGSYGTVHRTVRRQSVLCSAFMSVTDSYVCMADACTSGSTYVDRTSALSRK